MQILGTGLSGLLGSRLIELLPMHSFTNLSKEVGVDITIESVLEEYVSTSKADWVFHFAAFTDVDAAESQRKEAQDSIVWKINVLATKHLAQLCKKYNKRLLYISTDYVFDGVRGEYSENDIPNPTGFYAETKREGEKIVASLQKQGLIVRISNPYRAIQIGKKDFVAKIREILQKTGQILSPVDQFFSPTFIDDIVYGMQELTKNDCSGIYHLVGGDCLTPFDAVNTIIDVFHINGAQIIPSTFHDFLSTRAPRPQRACLKHDKILSLGIIPKTFREGLLEVKRQQEMAGVSAFI